MYKRQNATFEAHVNHITVHRYSTTVYYLQSACMWVFLRALSVSKLISQPHESSLEQRHSGIKRIRQGTCILQVRVNSSDSCYRLFQVDEQIMKLKFKTSKVLFI